MHKKLYSLMLAVMLGSMHMHAQYVPEETYEFDSYELFRIRHEQVYQEYVAFENYLETDASLEVKAVVKNIERDLVLGCQILINCMEGMIRRNALLVIDECKDNSDSLRNLADDLRTIIEDIGYVSQEFIFKLDENDDTLDMEPEEGLIFLKNKIEEFFAFIDILPIIYGQPATYRAALVSLDTIQEQAMCSKFKEKCLQVDPFSQQFFVNSIPAIQANLVELRAVLHSLIDTSFCLIEMTDCSQQNYVWFMQTRIQKIVDIYSQLAQEFTEEHGGRFEGKNVKDLSQEDMTLAIELDVAFCELCQKVAQQMLVGLENPA